MSKFSLTGVCALVLFAAFAANANADYAAGDRISIALNGVNFAFRYCPDGTLGSTPISSFWMAETETTQGQYKSLMNGSNPSKADANYFEGGIGDKLAVNLVSWTNAQDFVSALNIALTAAGFTTLEASLQSVAQWEYASRAGATSKPNLNDVAWYNGTRNGVPGVHEVATKDANAWGIYDTLGNAWEWTNDSNGGDSKKTRGGGWLHNSDIIDWGINGNSNYWETYDDLSFRVVLTGTYEAPGGGGDGNAAPEPATLALFGLGLGGLALVRRRRK